MEENVINSGRRYKCACCGKAVLIGTCCDRGNRYCAGDCSFRARLESVRESGRRYRQTRNGKIKGNARQARFRQLRRKGAVSAPILPEENPSQISLAVSAVEKIVTHHGGPPYPLHVAITPIPAVMPLGTHKPFCCHFCGRMLSEFVRTGKLTRRVRHPIPLYTLHDRRKQHHDDTP